MASSVNLGLRVSARSAVNLRIRIPSRISPREAIALQKKLAPLIETESADLSHITHLVGCDATYLEGVTIAAASLVNYRSLQVARIRALSERTRFPYIPGLLAFREAPSVIRAVRALKARSYVCMVDGHGLAHPRGFGLACFVGLALGHPTIGVAKSLLYGQVDGNRVMDEEGRQIAETLTLPVSGKVIYVSTGNMISLKDAVTIVKGSLSPRGPIPIIAAHDEVTKEKWRLRKSNQAS